MATVQQEAGVYTNMEIWAEVRRRVLAGEISKREACREYRLHWDTLTKILTHEEPPGYRRQQPRAKPTLGPFLPVIPHILQADPPAPNQPRPTPPPHSDPLAP